MNTHILPASDADGLTRGPLHGLKGHRPPVTSHESPVTSCKSFSFTLLLKNASANHLESHSCKNKGLKVPCFHTLTKNIGGRGAVYLRTRITDHESRVTNHESRPLSPFAGLKR